MSFSGTGNHVVTIPAIEAKKGVAHVFAMLGKKCLIALCAIRTLITGVALFEKQTIDAIARALNPVPVHTAFTLAHGKSHVAVLVARRVVRIFAILTIEINETQARHHHLQILVLIKKAPRKINLSTILLCIPSISPPACLAIDHIR